MIISIEFSSKKSSSKSTTQSNQSPLNHHLSNIILFDFISLHISFFTLLETLLTHESGSKIEKENGDNIIIIFKLVTALFLWTEEEEWKNLRMWGEEGVYLMHADRITSSTTCVLSHVMWIFYIRIEFLLWNIVLGYWSHLIWVGSTL